METLKTYLNKETLLQWSTLGWVLSALVTFMMLVSGFSKIVGTAEMVGNFEYMKLTPYLLMVGLMEVMGGIMLMVPMLSRYGAVLVASVMSAAVCMHLSLSMPNTMMPVVLGAMALVGYFLRSK
jgi:uncharacterized membrane protein YphA (DoxX/SURF4 family)